jgi:hypothetical protein
VYPIERALVLTERTYNRKFLFAGGLCVHASGADSERERNLTLRTKAGKDRSSRLLEKYIAQAAAFPYRSFNSVRDLSTIRVTMMIGTLSER